MCEIKFTIRERKIESRICLIKIHQELLAIRRSIFEREGERERERERETERERERERETERQNKRKTELSDVVHYLLH